jgi:predicted AAA+ superfamily ATPase
MTSAHCRPRSNPIVQYSRDLHPLAWTKFGEMSGLKVLPKAKTFNLLRAETVLNLTRDLTRFKQEVLAQPENSWIVVDEVQRLPRLLDDVHDILNDHTYRFVLSGSSARKLKQLEANMLAGRAIRREFFPLVGAERNFDASLDEVLSFGNLPELCNHPESAVDILDAYVATYLKEEIAQEALDGGLDSFSQFLRVAGILNGE